MSVNPFDIRTVILAKHAQHVVLIHFPMALFTAAVAFDYLGHSTKSRKKHRRVTVRSTESRNDRARGTAQDSHSDISKPPALASQETTL